ncbi:MAG: recombination protein RecO [Helicobacteraceae bacterium]|nr:recombination protein RecO [Helicobacteraceae bacterium]
MRGFILDLRKHRAEDLIVTILTDEKVLKLYRFYGVRHSPIQLGYKVDFAVEHDPFFMPRLRSVWHLGYKWLFDLKRARLWQRFCQILQKHLRDAEKIDDFYFAILEKAAAKMERQNPERVLIEAMIEILDREGRLFDISGEFSCEICEEKIEDDRFVLLSKFSPAHENCVSKRGFLKSAIARLFNSYETILLSDVEVGELFGNMENEI